MASYLFTSSKPRSNVAPPPTNDDFIRALADGLENDPQLIFEFVNNHITAQSIGSFSLDFATSAEGYITGVTATIFGGVQLTPNLIGLYESTTDALNRTTTFAYDEMNRPTAITDPLNRTTQFSYDPRGDIDGVTAPLIGAIIVQRNGLGLPTTLTDLNAEDWTMTATYDDDNRITNANGRALSYDGEGRVVGTSADTSPRNFTATYDDAGRLSSVTYDGLFSVTYTYDPDTGVLREVSEGDARAFAPLVLIIFFVNLACGYEQIAGKSHGQRMRENGQLAETFEAAQQFTEDGSTLPSNDVESAESFFNNNSDKIVATTIGLDGRIIYKLDGVGYFWRAAVNVAIDE